MTSLSGSGVTLPGRVDETERVREGLRPADPLLGLAVLQAYDRITEWWAP